MQLHQLTDSSDEEEEEEEDEEDGVTELDGDLVESYYEALGFIGECVDYLESSIKTMPRKRQLRQDIETHLEKVKEYLDEQGFGD